MRWYGGRHRHSCAGSCARQQRHDSVSLATTALPGSKGPAGHHLAKVRVASSNLVVRSIETPSSEGVSWFWRAVTQRRAGDRRAGPHHPVTRPNTPYPGDLCQFCARTCARASSRWTEQEGLRRAPHCLRDLRHTHATILLNSGVAVKVVIERLGRAYPAFTMTLGQHVLPRDAGRGGGAVRAVLDEAKRRR